MKKIKSLGVSRQGPGGLFQVESVKFGYPTAAADIARLTRAECAHRPPVAAKKP
jgi:hypothetical protein